ncbi:nascent polypeptide-associated complex protein [archaeon]|nr:nascent polypeptide-associated complex protein [archaeon]
MFPGLGGMNPKQMQGMLKQLGIKTEEISAKRVVIELLEGSKIIIEQPQVSAMNIQGQKTYTVIGKEVVEEAFNKEDIELIMQQAGCDEETAKQALKENDGDLAKAIESLKKEE